MSALKLSRLLSDTEIAAKCEGLDLIIRNGSIRIRNGKTLFRYMAEKTTGHYSESLAYDGLSRLLGENYDAVRRAFLQGHFMNTTVGRRARWVRRLLMRRLRLKESQEETRYLDV